MFAALRRARGATDRNPTPAQILAGNYAKGKVRLHGLEVAIENTKGSIRRSKPGRPVWAQRLTHDYGYIKRTEGADGDHVDVFLGPHLESELVFVIDQVGRGGRFDEHKVIIGARSAAEARGVYLSNYSAGWKGLGAITAMPVGEFKEWLANHDTTAPASPKKLPPHLVVVKSGLGEVESSALFPVHLTLNPKIWTPEKRLRPEVRQQLVRIAREFLRDPRLPKVRLDDITLTGSSANYNWTTESDLDLHLVVDFGSQARLKRAAFDFKRSVWNERHDIRLEGLEVEVYVQDPKEPHYATGVYSVEKDRWIKEPSAETFSTVVDLRNVGNKARSLAQKIDGVEALVGAGECAAALAKAEQIQESLKRQRQAGLEHAGEVSIENLAFKLLRRTGQIQRLVVLKTKAYDCLFSLGDKRCEVHRGLSGASEVRKAVCWPLSRRRATASVDREGKVHYRVFAKAGPRRPVGHPGIRGGRYWVDEQGHIRYGERPQGGTPAAPHTAEQQTPRPSAAGQTDQVTAANERLRPIGIAVSERRGSKTGNVYVAFSGKTYPQLARFRALKEQRLVWGFRQEGVFYWACKPEHLERVMKELGNAPEPKATEPRPQPREPRPDRGGDDRGGTQPERDQPRGISPGAADVRSQGAQPRGAPESGGPSRAPAASAERPEGFRKYGEGDERAEHWQVSEVDYISERHKRDIARAERTSESWKRQLQELPERRPSRRRSRFSIDPREQARSNSEYWAERGNRLRGEGPTPKERDSWRNDYIKLVREAISKGRPVPAAVIAQRPEFQKARDARARYEKGRHTSFANESVAVNRTMQERRGYKVKRQDGKAISEGQIQEIGAGMDEVEEALGPLRDLVRRSDLTISHTSGKHPFLSQAGGMYHGNERTVSMGINDVLERPVPSLAHELGHWLDLEAGTAQGAKTLVGGGPYSRRRAVYHSSLAEHDARTDGASLPRRARRTMNRTREVRVALKQKLKEQETPQDIAQIERVKVQLGPYWDDPREIWARLVEQYVTTVRGSGGVASESDYTRMPGWWTADDFAQLLPEVREEIARRIKILGGNPSQMKELKENRP